jgi:hypothetical protein
MTSKFLHAIVIAFAMGLGSFNTQAASIWLEPASQDIAPFGVASLNLYADASDVGGFLAGGLDLIYDNTLLSYNGDFTFDAATLCVTWPTDPAGCQIDPDLSRTGDDCATNPGALGCTRENEINSIAFGSFSGVAANGPTLIGSLSFTSTGPLGTALLTMEDNDLPAGNWFSVTGADLAGLVEYGSAEVNVVPIPAAVWLMFGGLGMLVGFARKRKA